MTDQIYAENTIQAKTPATTATDQEKGEIITIPFPVAPNLSSDINTHTNWTDASAKITPNTLLQETDHSNPVSKYDNYRSEAFESRLQKTSVIILDFETVLQKALHQNWDIITEEINTDIQKDVLNTHLSRFLPSITMATNSYKNNYNVNLSDPMQVPQSEYVQNRYTLDLNLFEGGRVFWGTIAAKNRYTGQQYRLEDREQDILARTIQEFYGLIRYKEELGAELERLSRANRNYDSRLKSGNEMSTLIAQQEIQRAKANIARLRAKYYISSERVTQYIRLDPHVLIVPSPAASDSLINNTLVKYSPNFSFDRVYEIAKRNNNDLRSYEYEVMARKNEQIQSLSVLMPRVSLQQTYRPIGYDRSSMSTRQEYSFNVSYDAFQNLGGRFVTDYLLAKDKKLQSDALYYGKMLSLRAKLSEDFLNAIANREVYRSNTNILEYSQKAFDIVSRNLKEGKASGSDLAVAQSALADARANYYQSLVDYRSSQVTLLRTLGLIDISTLLKGIEL